LNKFLSKFLYKNMKRLVISILILILIFESIVNGLNINEKIEKIEDVKIDSKDYYTIDPGCPMLPVIIKTFSFPIGTRIIDVDCIPLKIEKLKVKLTNAIGPLPLGFSFKKQKSNITEYPKKWYTYNIGVGLYNNERKIFVAIAIFPIRCFKDGIRYSKEFRIIIRYEKIRYENSSISYVYDMIIIAPKKFSGYLEALVKHKEKHGIKTILFTTEEIYRNYNGRDNAEKIKYFIKDAIEKWGIKYVLLVGGMKGQRFKWYVPVRYSNLDDNSSWETAYISDLYYADIYKYDNGIKFDDWDSNGNGIFAEWTKENKDILDLYPDVYVGRLPCRNIYEVKLMVEKIIKYETNFNKEWFKRMVVIGGDSFPDKEVGTDYIEGQVECDYALSFMKNFEHIRIYVKGGDIEFTPENAIKVISQGEGFIYFSGHGNPASWATHPYNDFDTWIDFGINCIMKLNNGEKLPIVVVGGCHNCQFNVSILRFFKKGIWAYFLGEMVPECWGWLFTRKIGGGAIATIGNTGLGYGTIGDGPVDEVPDSIPDGIPDCIQYLGGWLEPHFFEVYSKGKEILGETWGIALIDYLNRFPIDWSKDWIGIKPYTIDLINCKTVQEWVLIGDPSLKIGGYFN